MHEQMVHVVISHLQCGSFYFIKLYKIRIHILCRHFILTKFIVYKLQNLYFAVVCCKDKIFHYCYYYYYERYSQRRSEKRQINSVNGNDTFQSYPLTIYIQVDFIDCCQITCFVSCFM